MEEFLIKEGEFEYLEKGKGEPIIILHGLFGALSNFKETFDHFSKEYQVVIPKLPIYTLPIINTNISSLAKYLTKFIKHKGFHKVNLLGNSLGGHIALAYSAKNPNNVNRLILTGSSGLYENAFGGSFPRREDKEYLREKIGLTFYDASLATDDLVNECYETVNDRGRLIRILALAKSAIRHNMAKELPNMLMQTCLIWGKNDTITPPEVAEEFNELIPHSKLYWIEKCGHAPMMEHPNEFIQILEDWLNKNKD
jgi:2-hydroxy-6-oxonona-2,4-dienedioate hydrolase